MRSVYLARAARRKGLAVHFQARNQYTADILAGLGETVIATVPNDGQPGVLVIDAPTTTSVSTVKDLQQQGLFVVLIDVLTEARAKADIVCDALMTPRRAEKLAHSDKTIYLYGLEYACLDEQFQRQHGMAMPMRNEAKLLIAFGGSDILKCNARFLEALNRQGFHGPAEIVAGMGGAALDEISAIVATWRDTRILSNVKDMALRMADADLVITKLGMTQLEAFCVGRDCVVVEPSQAHVDLQRELDAAYSDWPVVQCGLVADMAFEQAAKVTISCLSDRRQRQLRGARASQLVDGKGATRIIDAVMQATNSRARTERRWE